MRYTCMIHADGLLCCKRTVCRKPRGIIYLSHVCCPPGPCSGPQEPTGVPKHVRQYRDSLNLLEAKVHVWYSLVPSPQRGSLPVTLFIIPCSVGMCNFKMSCEKNVISDKISAWSGVQTPSK